MRHFSATTDLWSSEGMKPICLTQFILFLIGNFSLEVFKSPEDHNLAEATRSSLEAWELDESKQVCLTTDSGVNIVNAASRLNCMKLSCFGHNLHLAITNSIKCDD